MLISKIDKDREAYTVEFVSKHKNYYFVAVLIAVIFIVLVPTAWVILYLYKG